MNGRLQIPLKNFNVFSFIVLVYRMWFYFI